MGRLVNSGMAVTALIGALNLAHSQSPPPPSTVAAERAVTDFYAWYVPMARSDKGPHLRALQERRAQFADPLDKALRAEWAATSEGGEEIDGLDADPLLNAQEPCEQYRPVRTTTRGMEFLVEVLGTGHCQVHQKPDVIVQVAWRENRPVFVNFLYSRRTGDDLLSLLRRLASQRRRTSGSSR